MAPRVGSPTVESGMAEAARRLESWSNPDVVRRLIARPIRLEHSRLAPPQPISEEAAGAEEPDAAAVPTVARDVDQLEAELSLLKAVLQAEREETAQLRARLADPDSDADVRAMRDRWAALVDHLLLTRR